MTEDEARVMTALCDFAVKAARVNIDTLSLLRRETLPEWREEDMIVADGLSIAEVREMIKITGSP